MTRLNALERSVGCVARRRVRQAGHGRPSPRQGAARCTTRPSPTSSISARASRRADDEEDGLARLGGELPEGFGDEFFGPLSSVRINGSRVAAEARHG